MPLCTLGCATVLPLMACKVCGDQIYGWITYHEWTPAEFQRNVESVLEARRLWARREITKTTLGDVIKAAGFAPTDEGLLADPDLLMGGALLRRWNYDWMHCAFQAGFMSEAMWLAFKNIAILKFGSIGAGGDSMIGYLRQCQFPQCRRSVG